MELNLKQFISGFNNGYLLAKYESVMLARLLEGAQPINSYISGLLYGQKEYELEQTKGQTNELELMRQKTRNEKDLRRD